MDTQTLKVKNFVVKFTYASLLYTFTPDIVIDFFEKHPLTIRDRELNTRELLDYIWDNRNYLSARYTSEVLRDVERVYIEHGLDFMSYYRSALINLDGGFDIRSFAWLFIPAIKYLIGQGDFYKGLFKAARHASRRMHPGTFAGPLRFSKISRDETEVLTAFAFDETFRQEIPAFDCEFHLIQTALYGPLRFKMPPCSRFEIHAEGQSVFDRVKPEYNPEIMESIFTINKEPYGRIVKLHEFLENRSLRIAPLAPPDCDVVLCEKDYFSPYHKRIMLRNGTVYGAPLHLYSIRYTPSPQTASEEILQTISNELIDPEQSAWSEIRRRHEQALRMVAPEVTVEFLTGTGFIKVNGKYIASGIPAKLLRNILITSRKEKRFDFREQELFHLCHAEPGISEAGIMEYVQTIIRSLKETGSQLTLARSGKKKYVLKTTGQISYMEKPAA